MQVANKVDAVVADAVIEAVAQTACGLVSVEGEAAKGREPFIKQFRENVLPYMALDANGKLDMDNKVNTAIRKVFDEAAKAGQIKGSHYDCVYVLNANGDGIKVWTKRILLESRNDKGKVTNAAALDKLESFTVSAAVAYNEGKVKFDPLVMMQIVKPTVGVMENARRQAWSNLKKGIENVVPQGRDDSRHVENAITRELKHVESRRKTHADKCGTKSEVRLATLALKRLQGYDC
jgi:hypothetical protein